MMNALTGTSFQITKYPRIILANNIYSLTERLYVIGRKTRMSSRTYSYPSIFIDDPNSYISSTQARIYENSGKWVIENIAFRSETNKTFIYENNGYIPINSPRELKHGDIIALCYDSQKGPYMTMQFKLW